MFKCNFKSYEGTKEYIFISYAHKDSPVVYPIIEELNARGYRVWYDDGISPGSEWPEYIARHIDTCDIVLFFASPNSVASENCRREVNFTISRNKKFLNLIIEPTDFSLGMELQLSSYQSVMKYEYTDDESFYAKLFSTNLFDKCLREPGEEEESAKVLPPVIEADIEAHNIMAKAVETPASEEVSTTVVEDTAFKVADTTNSISGTQPDMIDDEPAPKKKSKAPIFILAGVALLLVIVVGVIVIGGASGVFLFVNGTGDVQITDSYSASRDESYVTIYDSEITADTINKISKLKSMTYLTFNNCTFAPDADLSKLKQVDKVTSFSINNCTGISDYSFLSKMTSLTYLSVTDDSNFNDLSYIANLDIMTLIIDNTGVTDLSCVSNFDSIGTLSCNNCKIDPSSINITATYFSSISMENCGLDSTDFLKNCKYLSRVNLSNNEIDNIEFVSTNLQSLKELNLSNTKLSNESVAMINNCVSLNKLYLNNVPVGDSIDFSNITQLSEISLSGCGIDDLSTLDFSKVSSIEYINVSNNKLKTLNKIPADNCGYSLEINIANNEFTSLAFLKDASVSTLIMYNNSIDFTEANKLGVFNGDYSYIATDYDDELINSPGIKECYRVYIPDCPVDKINELSDEFGYGTLIISYSADQLDEFSSLYSSVYDWPN